jgi:hypothetical protein
MSKNLSRRCLLGGMGVLAGASAVGVSSNQARAANPIDFSDPVDNLKASVKLLGTLGRGNVHYWYSGQIFGVTPDDSVPLIGYAGLIKGVWLKLGEDNYLYRIYDNGYYADLETGKPVDEFENPLTGIIVRPLHYHGGPFDNSKTPAILDWTRCGDEIWTEQHLGAKFINKLDPAEWPLASSGKTIRIRYVEGFRGRISDLENPDIVSAPCHLTSTHVAGWMPWLLMGQQPGSSLWCGQGKKIFDLDEIPEVTMRYLEADMPGYIESDGPWAMRSDTYLEYKTQRKPAKQ